MEKNNMKPDKTCHKTNEMGTEAKDSKLPGQMYCPKVTANSANNFAGDKK